jgi:hypothetical protein
MNETPSAQWHINSEQLISCRYRLAELVQWQWGSAAVLAFRSVS